MEKTELLKKFLNNGCNAQEAEIVMQYLEAEPGLLDEILGKSEWDAINDSRKLDPVMASDIKQKIFQKTIRPVYRLRPVLAAAAITSAFIIGLVLMNNSNRNPADAALYADKVEYLAPSEIIKNTSVSVKKINLPDHSIIELYSGSSVEYNINFIQNRSVILNGKAVFDVVKNAESPFVVVSGAITTTALGTRFLVDNSQNMLKVNVKLFEGRVVVQPLDSNMLIAATFLNAGEQCFIDINTRFVKVKSLKEPKFAHANTKKLPVKVQSIIPEAQSVRLNFSKASMPEVLEKLQSAFNRHIEFDRDDIQEIYFTGSFSLTDSLSTILSVISVMNDLKISMDGNIIQVIKDNDENPKVKMSDDGAKKDKSKIGIIENPVLEELIPDSAEIDEPVQSVREIVLKKEATRYNGISLAGLFEDLQKHTKRKIHFNKKGLENTNFTGVVPVDQPVRQILKMVCKINGLTLDIKKQTYYISKAEKQP